MAEKLARDTYLTKNTGNFPETFEIGGRRYVKIDDLRYGTNPHQPAAAYKPEGYQGAIMDMVTLKVPHGQLYVCHSANQGISRR